MGERRRPYPHEVCNCSLREGVPVPSRNRYARRGECPGGRALRCANAAGQLELNVMTPYVAYALLELLGTLTNATRSFEEKCVRGIQANRDRCRMYAEGAVGLAALHNQELGFMGAAKLAPRAIGSGKSVRGALGEADKPGKGRKYGSAN